VYVRAFKIEIFYMYKVVLSIMPITKETIKAICHAEHITMKELACKADMNYNGLLDKFRRKSMTVKDLERLLSSIGYSLQIIKNERSIEKKEK